MRCRNRRMIISQFSNKLLVGLLVYSGIVLSCGQPPVLAQSFRDTVWNASDYEFHDHTSFFSLDIVHQTIDLTDVNYALLQAAIFFRTNEIREQHDLHALQYSENVEQAALNHSNDMVEHDFFSHTSPVPGRRTVSDRLAEVGIGGPFAENLTQVFSIQYEAGRPVYPLSGDGQVSYQHSGDPIPVHTYASISEVALEQWMNSSGHRRNILLERMNFMAIGAARFTNDEFYNIDMFAITQNFTALP